MSTHPARPRPSRFARVASLGAPLGRIGHRARLLLGRSGVPGHRDALSRLVVDNSVDGVVTADERGVVQSCNGAAAAMFDRPAREAIGRPLSRLLPAVGDAAALAALAGSDRLHELAAARPDGGEVPVEVAFSVARVDGRPLYIAAVRDIGERRARQEQLERLALHDPLTGLPNRTLLFDRIDEAIRRAGRDGQTFALLLLDLDRFEEVNDALGHPIGDRLLQQVGPRMRTPLGASDTLARIGGDEFAVLLPPATDLETARRTAERIGEALGSPFEFDGLALEVGVRVGVALYPDHGQRTSELIQNADVAVSEAKRSPRRFAIYSPEADARGVRSVILSGELRRAIEEDQLVLQYQPKVEAATGRLAGVEALVRWERPGHGLLPPGDFLRAAEQAGLIRPLTLWVLDTALHQQGRWRQAGYDLQMAVNLAVTLLQDPELPELIGQVARDWETPPDRLTLEVSEGALMADPGTAADVLTRLAASGCRLALDDFGTGCSSLVHLQKLPVHELKLDRSFITALTSDESAPVVVRSLIMLAHSLGLSVVAKGVETERVLEWLRALSCDQVQGYLFGKPMPGPDLERLLKGGPWGQHLQRQSRRTAPA